MNAEHLAQKNIKKLPFGLDYLDFCSDIRQEEVHQQVHLKERNILVNIRVEKWSL